MLNRLIFDVHSRYIFADAISDNERLPIDVSFISPLAGSDLLLCAVFGGVISGIGSGLTIRFGGAIDGIDVLSVIFSKKIGISIGTFVMIFNTILYTDSHSRKRADNDSLGFGIYRHCTGIYVIERAL